MTLADLKPGMVLTRDEPRWDDDMPEPVRYRVETDLHTGRLVLVRRAEEGYGLLINRLDPAKIDLTRFTVA